MARKSPLTNLRNNRWGGSLENRASLLLEVIKSVCAKVSPEFAIAVKLNSTPQALPKLLQAGKISCLP